MTVTDTGPGMSDEELARALQPFGQVHNVKGRPQEGTGLGLPLCRRFMEGHDGELVIDSAPGEGTAVTLRFPAARSLPA